MKYRVEFYLGDAEHPETGFESGTPFGAIHVGDLVASIVVNEHTLLGQYYVVESVQHVLTGGRATMGLPPATYHGIMVRLDPTVQP